MLRWSLDQRSRLGGGSESGGADQSGHATDHRTERDELGPRRVAHYLTG